MRFASGIVLALAIAIAPTVARAQEIGPGTPQEAPRPALTPPRLIESPPVELPEGAEPLPPEASVELLITIAADGSVGDAQIATPLREDVDALVLEAARGMRFEPATRDGQPIPARIRFRYRISVPEPAPPPAPVETPTPPAEETPTPEGETTPPPEGEDTEIVPPPEETPTFGARATVDRPEPGATTRITLTGAELSTVPGTFGEPLRVVASLPGVSRSPFGIGFYVVRGANFNNTGFMIDGFPVPILYHFGFGPAVIANDYVERLRFYPGNYPVAYGRFSGGLIAVDTTQPVPREIRAELSLDALRAAVVLAMPWDGGRGSVSLAFRRSYYELLLPLFIDGLSLQYTDYQLRAQYRFDRGFSASVFLFGSEDTLDQTGAIGGGATSAGSNTAITINFQRIIARFVWRIGEGSTVTLSGTVGRDGQFFGSANVGEARQRFELETFNTGLRLDIALNVAPWLGFNTGLDLAGSTTQVDVTAPAPSGLGEYPRPVFDPQLIRLTSTAARGTPGAYAEGVLRFDPVEVSLGVRMDVLRYGSVTTVAPDPRVVARWRVLPEWLLKAGSGLFTQPPIAVQTISTGGNPGLGPTRSWQNSVGTEIDLPFDIDVEVNGFYSHMFDLARFTSAVGTGPDGQPRREFFRADQEGRAYGLEVLIRRPVTEGFYAWVSYTLSRSERRRLEGWELFNQDQEHVLNLVASYYVDGWRFGGRFVLASGRPIEDIRGGVYDADANDYDPTFTGTTSRLPIYHQLDLRVDRDFNIDNVIRGTVFLEVLNVYYAENAEGLVYQYDYQRSVPLPGVPILGTLGIRAAYDP
ncbi:TonB family protein [Sandaracinus amylolyticus]|uniref:TonB family protein / TonB-dependent receptor n=1 Tax=Sandaracinus amylolyticus TaxID=927083 RepID=A0A0F6YM59_9BACT|nr:TonB family protein [Sandaracinus amylolyticus]AKF09916.1 TonB family protein / TonB-dependent receptor [Sandaracinus amylolyticus]